MRRLNAPMGIASRMHLGILAAANRLAEVWPSERRVDPADLEDIVMAIVQDSLQHLPENAPVAWVHACLDVDGADAKGGGR